MRPATRTEDQGATRRKRLQSGSIPYPIPSHYNFYLFFGLTNLIGISVIVGSALFVVREVQPLEWMAVVVAFLFANFVEYICHRGPMHNPLRMAEFLFKPHTRSHHEYFGHDTMSIDNSQEAYKVLFFFRDTFSLLGLLSPLFALVWYLLNRNVAGLTLMTFVGYFLFYEWMHLAYHAPDRYRIDRIPLLGRLKRNHQIHHDKARMNDVNFNLTLPIWDVILGTLYRPSQTEAQAKGLMIDSPMDRE